MKVLVTGGAGFIGSHLVGALLGRGDEVAIIDDFNDYYDPALKRANVALHGDKAGLSVHEGDIRDAAFVDGVVRSFSPDAVAHLAARAGVRPSIENPLLYEEVNSGGTIKLAEALRGRGVGNFVFASSSSVYGASSAPPFSEDDPASRPISPYAATKRSSELMLAAYSYLYEMPVTCLRFFTVYGERGRPDMAVARFTRAIWEGAELSLYGDGTARRDFTYVGDILSGIVAALDNPRPYEIINIGGAETVTVSRLIEIIEEKLGRKALIKRLPPVSGDVPLTHADVTKARRLLGFAPTVAIEEGVGRYVDWFLRCQSSGAPL